jgi:hypothetical protein
MAEKSLRSSGIKRYGKKLENGLRRSMRVFTRPRAVLLPGKTLNFTPNFYTTMPKIMHRAFLPHP